MAPDPSAPPDSLAPSGSPVGLATTGPSILVSVVIPVYNEEGTIQELVRRVLTAPLPPRVRLEIVCVNDRSTDGSAARLDELPALFPGRSFKVLQKQVNQGKGAALRDGFAAASGDIVLVQDADLEYDPQDYAKLLRPILEGRADVVFGSRFVGASRTASCTSGTRWATASSRS